jgi:serine/threonine-protein kinase
MSDLRQGSEFAGHRIEGVAGRGGMGVVYRAVQLALNRTVAIKVLAGELAESDQFRERFRIESEMAAAIDHPNVIPIYDAGEERGLLYVTMRYVDGTDLRQLAALAPLDPRRAVAIVASVGDALDAAHARGLVHRDVKPGNVLIEDRDGRDHAYLTDFGLTKQVSADPGLTETGNWLGTVDYAAPEQIRAKPVDARADVYALGGVLYWALTGSVPYPRASDLAKMEAHLHAPVPELVRTDAPAALGDVIARAMAKDPAERFQSAGQLGRAALVAAAGASEAAPAQTQTAAGEEDTRKLPAAPWSPMHAWRARETTAARGRRGQRGRIAVAAAIGLLLVAAVLALAGAFDSGSSPKRAAPSPAPRAHTPTNAEVIRFLQAYADRYGREDADGIGRLFAADGVRRNAGSSPESRSEAIAAYRAQFAQLEHPSYHVSGLRQTARPGAVTVTGRYAIASDSGTTTGRVAFHLVERGGRLSIKRLDIEPS